MECYIRYLPPSILSHIHKIASLGTQRKVASTNIANVFMIKESIYNSNSSKLGGEEIWMYKSTGSTKGKYSANSPNNTQDRKARKHKMPLWFWVGGQSA